MAAKTDPDYRNSLYCTYSRQILRLQLKSTVVLTVPILTVALYVPSVGTCCKSMYCNLKGFFFFLQNITTLIISIFIDNRDGKMPKQNIITLKPLLDLGSAP